MRASFVWISLPLMLRGTAQGVALWSGRSLAVLAIMAAPAPAPAAAQGMVWSATLTVGVCDDCDRGHDGEPDRGFDRGFGALSDIDFEYDGEPYVISSIKNSSRNVGEGRWLAIALLGGAERIEPLPDDLVFTLDGQTFAVGDVAFPTGPTEANPTIYQTTWWPVNLQWEEGQRVEVALVRPTTTPALPLVGLGMLGVLLVGGAARSLARRRK